MSLWLTWLGLAASGKVIPVMPEGPLFPDHDCLGVGVLNGIDWPHWLAIFEKGPRAWTSEGQRYFDIFMDGDEEAYDSWVEACPLGVLNGELALYYFSAVRGDTKVAASYRDIVSPKLAAMPLRTIIGSRWPLFLMLSSENLRKAPPPEGSPDVANDDAANCVHVDLPVLNWTKFQSLFWGEKNKVKDWMMGSIRYVYSWQMVHTPEEVLIECPLGYLTAVLIKAFTCATSESSCFHSFANQIEQFFVKEPDIVEVLAHSWWPLAMLLNHMTKATRHKYFLDFTEAELSGNLAAAHPGSVSSLGEIGRFLGTQDQASQSFRDLLSALPQLGRAPPEAPNLVYVTMIYGEKFNRHMRRFCSRARALGIPGERLILFTLDQQAYEMCLSENGGRCIRGSPGILNKFTLPLVCAHLGLDTVWIDLDVFLMVDPTPAIIAHAERGPYDILVSGSFEADCICNGIVYFRATPAVKDWLLGVLVWMYHHPYEHDQKTFSAFLNYTERVAQDPLDLPEIPPWDTLDPINQFVTPDIFEGNGWMGDLDKIIIYHFLNGESDTGSGLDPSGSWRKEYGRFTSDNETCEGNSCNTGGKVSLMDLFYGQTDEELYTTPMPAYENEAIRAALLSSRKAFRSTRLLGLPCGPMVGWEDQDEKLPPEVLQERLQKVRERAASERMKATS